MSAAVPAQSPRSPAPPRRRAWGDVFAGVVVEACATTALARSDGMTNLPLAALSLLCYALSFLLVARGTEHLDVSIVYGVWSGLGTLLVTGMGIVLYAESVSPIKLAGVALVVAGTVLLHQGSGREERPPGARTSADNPGEEIPQGA